MRFGQALGPFCGACLLLVSACTTVGFHSEDARRKVEFGPPAELKVCFIAEPGITPAEVDGLVRSWNEELALYRIQVKRARLRTMTRPGFYGSDILNHLVRLRLRSPCDRIVYLVGRTAGDMLFEAVALGVFAMVGLKLEVHGAVETITRTRGYVKARYMELGQFLFLRSGARTLVHEGYHLLGCGHALTLKECYGRIRDLKQALRAPGRQPDFFPTYGRTDEILLTREQVRRAMDSLQK